MGDISIQMPTGFTMAHVDLFGSKSGLSPRRAKERGAFVYGEWLIVNCFIANSFLVFPRAKSS
jgi:hypothetical protein